MSAGMTYALFVGSTIIVLCFGLFGDDDSAAYRWARFLAWLRMITRTAPFPQARLAPGPTELSAGLEDAPRLDGGRLRRTARSQVDELAAALAAAQGDPRNPGRDRGAGVLRRRGPGRRRTEGPAGPARRARARP